MSTEVKIIPKGKLTSLDRIKDLLVGRSDPLVNCEQQFYQQLFGCRNRDQGQVEDGDFASMMEVVADCELVGLGPAEDWDAKAVQFVNLFGEQTSDCDKIKSSVDGLLGSQSPELSSAIVEKMDMKTFNCLCQYLLRDLDEPDIADLFMVKDVVCRYTLKQLRIESKNPILLKLIFLLKTRYGAIVVENIVIPSLSEGLLCDGTLQQLSSNIGEEKLAVDVLISILNSRQNSPLSDQDLNLIEGILNDFQGLFSHHGIQSSLGAALDQSSSANTKNARFGKFLLNFIKKSHGPMDKRVFQYLHQSVSNHSTFLKKALELELKKKSSLH